MPAAQGSLIKSREGDSATRSFGDGRMRTFCPGQRHCAGRICANYQADDL